MSKPNCYDCKYRRNLAGNAHSKCAHPESVSEDALGELMAILASVQRVSPVTTTGAKILNIKGSSHGIRNGWFNWPFNFDPIWLESCSGFTPKNREEVINGYENNAENKD